MQTKTAKFGGTSLADAEMFRKVYKIIKEDESRRFIVPSAPGKRFPDDEKITDLLYRAYDMNISGQDPEAVFSKVCERFDEIITSLGMNLSLKTEFDNIRRYFGVRIGRDFFASRGEYLCGIILANLLGFEFIDAADVIFFKPDGEVDDEKTNLILKSKLSHCKNAVIPGFYGTAFDGTIKTFPRGGSDITGAIVAKATLSDVYENWTDVSGILMADPKIVESPASIKSLSYPELREMSFMGASVLHEDAVYPVRQVNIPINIKNTVHPEDAGTIISCDSPSTEKGVPCGITGKRGYSAIIIEKNSLTSDMGFMCRFFDIFEKNSVPVELFEVGVDNITVIFKDKYLTGKKDNLITLIKEKFEPDKAYFSELLSLVSVVGKGINDCPECLMKVSQALAKISVSPVAISKSAGGSTITVAVHTTDFEESIRAVYKAFN